MPNETFHSGGSQVYWTCHALLTGRAISHRTEIREVHGWRLGAIIHRLRHNYGWPIQTERRGPMRVAYYSLPPGTRREALRFPPSAAALADAEGVG